ncbi:chitooligosaccharidolytic beta-N-acetylglucosaminidase-like [Cylas formicarius]|uniref:chitooligosaccharidolytic beta-N-acetylglucosaminidase-like n=1 Tax=Cylas formicarius TaxID=197179 RepID=UPI002958707F|nr:chitooligosaccharidolytic beta-N-acetylglucosaminidase-like [Cylas formicarius]
MNQVKFVVVCAVIFNLGHVGGQSSVWHYECTQNYCLKTLITNETTSPQSYSVCNLLCLDAAGLWPKPTGQVSVANLVEVDVGSFSISQSQSSAISDLVSQAFQNFVDVVNEQLPERLVYFSKKLGSSAAQVIFNITDVDSSRLLLNTDESYSLKISSGSDQNLQINIDSGSFFGARHALETLSQLIVYDDINNQILIPSDVVITDKPKYPWRGVSVDTARNYVSVDIIKNIIKGLAAAKLNTFHWHITDSSSFPYESKSLPELSQFGAYSQRKVYDAASIQDIIDYATVRGIRVVPEFDAPAHVGEGWQNKGVLTCFNIHPWQSFCNEPPCGQFDPSKPELYDYLEELYGDLLEQFDPEVFHMGGDEVSVSCWNATEDLVDWIVNEKNWTLTRDDFIDNVWGYFQEEALQRLYQKAGREIPVILWTSDLTASDKVTTILPVDKYIIQVWTAADDAAIPALLDNNYTLILSNFDSLYLDCGFSSWVATGNNWCSPYKGWQQAYNNTPARIVGDRTNQVLGGEAAIWTEQADSASAEGRIFPRASAFGEALWTEPSTTWAEAEERFLLHRERLVSLGILADALEPEWCRQNQQNCAIGGIFNAANPSED